MSVDVVLERVLPEAIRAHRLRAELSIAIDACEGAAAALSALRGRPTIAEEAGGQLKTAIDRAAEGWVAGYLRGNFEDAELLCEEEFDRAGQTTWTPSGRSFWTVDALDGTRSFVEGFDGFCVQVALVEDGAPVLGVIAEPATGRVYFALAGAGAYRMERGGATTRLQIGEPAVPLRFVDSIPAGGPVGALMREEGAAFVECGSIGLKICRVAEGAADVYAKAFRYKLWDVAPGEVLINEAGGTLTTWAGVGVEYRGPAVHYRTVLGAPSSLTPQLVTRLGALQGDT